MHFELKMNHSCLFKYYTKQLFPSQRILHILSNCTSLLVLTIDHLVKVELKL